MANSKTNNFKLEYFTRGASYSAAADFRRFTTLDYNLEAYVGIIGAGVIKGWEIQQTSGLNIQILPGSGMIEGFAVESPYSYKQRHSMVVGDREIEEIHDIINSTTGQPIVYPYLTGTALANYITVIQAYDPTHVFPANIEDCFVKTATPYPITLLDNNKTYIYASRASGATPYPPAADFPSTSAIRPNAGNYTTYSDYLTALNVYLAQISTIHNYEWRANIANHYNAVVFSTALTLQVSTTKILIGAVTTSNGQVTNIDISDINVLANLESSIKNAAKSLLIGHEHGGSTAFDPPKVKLETDIRKTALSSYNINNRTAYFNVLEKDPTSLTIGHTHTFFIDNSGDGYTVDITGNIDEHYHNIASNVVSNVVSNNYNVLVHSHNLPTPDTTGGWESDSQFIVYLNDTVIGTQSSGNITADSNAKTLAISSLIGPTYRTYSMSFNFIAGASAQAYSYTLSTYSVLSFMVSAIIDFNNKWGSIVNTTNADGTINVDNNPFLFVNADGTTLDGFDDLFEQCLVAQKLLNNVGDNFLFTPNAADNITITLENISGNIDNYDVKFEILGNTEVTGILGNENITYVNAQKIQFGVFEIAQIPQISHIGRMGLNVLPFKYPLSSSDGYDYKVTPSITTPILDHYHGLFLDTTNSGVTNRVYVNNEPVYYATGLTGISYYIYHEHGVTDSIIGMANSSSNDTGLIGLLNWQNDINSTNVQSISHTHSVINPVLGNQKNIYSVMEVEDGSLYLGTSNGLILVPNNDCYLYVINGKRYYMVGSNLWDLLLQAKAYYESETSLQLVVTETIYLSQINKAYDYLSNNGDSYLLYGSTNNTLETNNSQDLIMIKKVDYFNVPNVEKKIILSDISNLNKNQTIVGIMYFDIDGNEVNAGSEDAISTVFVVAEDLSYTPVWSMDLRNISNNTSKSLLIAGEDMTAMNEVSNNFYNLDWTVPNLLDFSGSILKVYNDSQDNTWILTSGGMQVSRGYQNLETVETVNQPDIFNKQRDIVEGNVNNVYAACSDGIYLTVNQGYSWTNALSDSSGFSQIIRDYSKDKTNYILDHYHLTEVNIKGDGILSLSIGTYANVHSHSVSSWNVGTTLGHTHNFIITFYAISEDGLIYKSIDNGSTWNVIGNTPSEQHGDIFINGAIVCGMEDGLYEYQNNVWSKVFSEVIYSYAHGYNFEKVLLGGKNNVYSTTDFISFNTVSTLDGCPDVNLYQNNEPVLFNYAYSNLDNSFRFKDFEYSKELSFATIDFNKWAITGGGWSNTVSYDIYINENLALSTKKEVDNRTYYGYGFTVDNEDGIIDFSAVANIMSNISIYDSSFIVDNVNNFNIGDNIVIKSNAFVDVSNTSSSNVSSISENHYVVTQAIEDAIEIKNMIVYANISNIVNNTIYITERFDRNIILPAIVYKIPNLDSSTEIDVNIYESKLSNIGTHTHEELEDGLDKYYDGKPYNMGNSFLSNLLQLTQAIRYVIPDINTGLINSNFYDFHYSWNPSDSNYIGNYVDLFDCDIYNFLLFSNQFSKMGAKTVNKILFGKYSFDGTVFVATDIGVFYAAIETGLQGNWFYSGISIPVNDLTQFGSKIFACTIEGTYSTEDMKYWQLETQSAISFSSTKGTLRWGDQPTVNVSNHTAIFYNIVLNGSNCGSVTSFSNVYSDLTPNKKIEIINAGNISGTYTIQYVTASNNFSVLETFPIETYVVGTSIIGTSSIRNAVIYSNVSMREGAWWQFFNGDYNVEYPNISNPIIIGGKDCISYCSNSNSYTWSQSSLPAGNNGTIKDFNIATINIINNGSLLAATQSANTSSQTNYILECDGDGSIWNLYHEFDEIDGNITGWSITDFSHTKLNVNYSKSVIYPNGNMCKYKISIFESSSSLSPIYTGNIIWNENVNGNDFIYTYELDLYNVLEGQNGAYFKISPININHITSLEDDSIVYSTDSGLYSDYKSKLSNYAIYGVIDSIGYNAIVTAIDTSGTIMSAESNVVSNNTVFNILIGNNVSLGSLAGYSLYITDFSPIIGAQIVNNSGTLANGEVAIEVNLPFNTNYSTYSGKRTIIANSSYSRIYLTYGSTISDELFINGTATISTQNSSNYGKQYSIIDNRSNYIDVAPIIPISTLPQYTNITSNVAIGDSLLLTAYNQINLGVSYGNSVSKNQLSGFSFYDSNIGDALTIYSNDLDSIILSPFSSNSYSSTQFSIGDTFYATGFIFYPLTGFNNKLTSIEENHYHDANVINDFVTGEISSFSNVSSSYVEINAINTHNLNTSIMLMSNDLLEGAEIDIINPNDTSEWFKLSVISHSSNSVTVSTGNISNWDFSSYNQYKISEGWIFSIDAKYYGYTENTHYVDFVTNTTSITSDLAINSINVNVLSTASMVNGDKVIISDETLTQETNYVLSITGSKTIQLKNPTQYGYLQKNNPTLKVLRDSFANNHAHQIKNCQIETLSIPSYVSLGYDINHSHEIQPLLSNVSKVVEKGEKIVAVGSSGNIYSSYNIYDKWDVLIDLNSIEPNNSVSSVTDIYVNNDDLVIGTDNGTIAVSGYKTDVVPLIIPSLE